jgi:hypothetical protein
MHCLGVILFGWNIVYRFADPRESDHYTMEVAAGRSTAR